MYFEDFFVITVVSNPVRYESRYDLYIKFKEMCESAGVTLITVEQAFGERPFEVTEANNPCHVQVRSVDELWIKESLINLGINYALQIRPSLKYIAWVDADVSPMGPPRDWFLETWHQLQHYEIVQMFEWAQDLTPSYNPLGKAHLSFMSAYVKSGCQPPKSGGMWEIDSYERQGHPGYCWAANVSALTKLGLLIDIAVLGAGDRHMALGLVGEMEQSIQPGLHPNYAKLLMEWQERSNRHIKRDVGFVPGSIVHHYHGKKINRKYHDRWRILTENQFDPVKDLKRDAQGVWILESETERQLKLRDQIRAYFRNRDEDFYSIDETLL